MPDAEAADAERRHTSDVYDTLMSATACRHAAADAADVAADARWLLHTSVTPPLSLPRHSIRRQLSSDPPRVSGGYCTPPLLPSFR